MHVFIYVYILFKLSCGEQHSRRYITADGKSSYTFDRNLIAFTYANKTTRSNCGESERRQTGDQRGRERERTHSARSGIRDSQLVCGGQKGRQ